MRITARNCVVAWTIECAQDNDPSEHEQYDFRENCLHPLSPVIHLR